MVFAGLGTESLPLCWWTSVYFIVISARLAEGRDGDCVRSLYNLEPAWRKSGWGGVIKKRNRNTGHRQLIIKFLWSTVHEELWSVGRSKGDFSCSEGVIGVRERTFQLVKPFLCFWMSRKEEWPEPKACWTQWLRCAVWKPGLRFGVIQTVAGLAEALTGSCEFRDCFGHRQRCRTSTGRLSTPWWLLSCSFCSYLPSCSLFTESPPHLSSGPLSQFTFLRDCATNPNYIVRNLKFHSNLFSPG